MDNKKRQNDIDCEYPGFDVCQNRSCHNVGYGDLIFSSIQLGMSWDSILQAVSQNWNGYRTTSTVAVLGALQQGLDVARTMTNLMFEGGTL